MSIDIYKYKILDELFYFYCDTNKIDYIIKMLDYYPNRYHVILDGNFVLNAEIIKNGDLTHDVDPYVLSKKFKMFLTDENLIGNCKKCSKKYISLVRLNCDTNHYLCLKCLKDLVTYDGLCMFCFEEISLMHCTININNWRN